MLRYFQRKKGQRRKAGEVGREVGSPTDCQHSLFHAAGELSLDGFLDVVTCHLFVLGKNLPKLGVTFCYQNGIKDRFIGTPFALTGGYQCLSIADRCRFVNFCVFFTVSLHQRNTQPLEVSGSIALEIFLERSSVGCKLNMTNR